jgi:heptosyltransferase III
MTALLHRVRDLAIRPAARVTRSRSSHAGQTILVIQPDHLGDILLAQPAVQSIRDRFPTERIVGVVGPWSREIAEIAWPVDELITINFPGFERIQEPKRVLEPYLALRSAADLLSQFDPGPAFILRPDAWWAAWLASIVTPGPIVTACNDRMASFATHCTDISAYLHTTARAIAIASGDETEREMGAITPESYPIQLSWQPEAASIAHDVLNECGISERYVVIHPGSGADVKRWPNDRCRVVARALAEAGIPVIVTGSSGESAMAEAIATVSASVYPLAGKTSLPVLIELLRGATLAIGPDSGPLHLAVGCATPSIHLYGPSNPQRWGPWGPSPRHRVLSAGWSCSRCGDLSSARQAGCGCMLAISVDDVICLALEMIERNAAH